MRLVGSVLQHPSGGEQVRDLGRDAARIAGEAPGRDDQDGIVHQSLDRMSKARSSSLRASGAPIAKRKALGARLMPNADPAVTVTPFIEASSTTS